MNWFTNGQTDPEKDVEHFTTLLLQKQQEGELEPYTILSVCKEIYKLGQESGGFKMTKTFQFKANPQGKPFTATLQSNGNYLVTREDRVIREFTLKEIVNSFKHLDWETV